MKHVIQVQPSGSTQTRNHHMEKLQFYLNIRKIGNYRQVTVCL